jgi:hypothetical protein
MIFFPSFILCRSSDLSLLGDKQKTNPTFFGGSSFFFELHFFVFRVFLVSLFLCGLKGVVLWSIMECHSFTNNTNICYTIKNQKGQKEGNQKKSYGQLREPQ